MVRIHPDPPDARRGTGSPGFGAVAQLGERLLCKQEAVGSIPSSSTSKAIDCVGQCLAVCLGLSAKPNAGLFFNNSGR